MRIGKELQNNILMISMKPLILWLFSHNRKHIIAALTVITRNCKHGQVAAQPTYHLPSLLG